MKQWFPSAVLIWGLSALAAMAQPTYPQKADRLIAQLQVAVERHDADALQRLAAPDIRTSFGPNPPSLVNWLEQQPLAFEMLEKALVLGCKHEENWIQCPPDLTDTQSSDIDPILQVAVFDHPLGAVRDDKRADYTLVSYATDCPPGLSDTIETFRGVIPIRDASGVCATVPASHAIWLSGRRIGIQKRAEGWQITYIVAGD